jgi:hypothetical protein
LFRLLAGLQLDLYSCGLRLRRETDINIFLPGWLFHGRYPTLSPKAVEAEKVDLIYPFRGLARYGTSLLHNEFVTESTPHEDRPLCLKGDFFSLAAVPVIQRDQSARTSRIGILNPPEDFQSSESTLEHRQHGAFTTAARAEDKVRTLLAHGYELFDEFGLIDVKATEHISHAREANAAEGCQDAFQLVVI